MSQLAHPPTAGASSAGPELKASGVVVTAVLSSTLLTPLYPLVQRADRISGVLVAIVFASYAVVVVATLLVFDDVSDQIGRRPVLLAGLGFALLSALMLVIGHTLPELFVARCLSGLSAGLFVGTGTAYILDLAPAGNPQRAALTAAVASIVGLGIGPLLSGLLSQYLPDPSRLTFIVDGVLLIAMMSLIWSLPETVSRSGQIHLTVTRPGVPASARATFERAATAGFAGFVVFGLFSAVLPSALGELFGIHNRAAVGAIVAILFFASVAGQVSMQLTGESRGLTTGSALLIVGVALLGISFALTSLPCLMLAAAIAGFAQGLAFRAGFGLVTDESPPERRGEVASAFFSVLYVGISLPVVIIGVVASQVGLRPAAIGACACVIALVLAVARPRRIRDE